MNIHKKSTAVLEQPLIFHPLPLGPRSRDCFSGCHARIWL